MAGMNKGMVIGGGALVVLLLFYVASPGMDASIYGLRGAKVTYESKTQGAPDTLEFRRYFYKEDGSKMSPWHDIPLQPTGAPSDVFNFICEIPQGTRAKMETNKETAWNPIIQDTKKGKLRYYHSDSLVNYGAIPQTWEDPEHKEPSTGNAGDNDPLDVLEIGERACHSGDVYPVKVLGILAMVDDGEMDWKLVVVRTDDALAPKVDDIGDDNKDANPGVQEFLVNVRNWFRDYKIPDGKPANVFAFDDKYLSKAKGVEIVNEQHGFWKALVSRDPSAANDQDKPYADFWWHK